MMAANGGGGPKARRPDACPYSRPFPEGFEECPTLHPVRYVPLNMAYRMLRPVLTCRHLVVGVDTLPGRFYARCSVGTAEDRLRAAGAVREDRTRAMRRLADGINALILKHWEAMAAAKSHQLEPPPGADPDELARAVQEAGDHLVRDAADRVEGDWAADLELLGAAPASLLNLIQGGVNDYVRRGFESWEVPDELLEPLPPDVARFLKARYGG